MISDALLQDKTPKKLAAFASRCVNVAYEIVDPGSERMWMTTLQELIAATATAAENPTDVHKGAVMELRRGTPDKPGLATQLTRYPATSADHALLSSAIMASQIVAPDSRAREPHREAAAAARMAREAVERARPELSVGGDSRVPGSERPQIEALTDIFEAQLSASERGVFAEMVSAGWPSSWDSAVAQSRHTSTKPMADAEMAAFSHGIGRGTVATANKLGVGAKTLVEARNALGRGGELVYLARRRRGLDHAAAIPSGWETVTPPDLRNDPEPRPAHAPSASHVEVRLEHADNVHRVAVTMAGRTSTSCFASAETAERIARDMVRALAVQGPELINNPLGLSAVAAWLPETILDNMAAEGAATVPTAHPAAERVRATDVVRLSKQATVSLCAAAAETAKDAFQRDLAQAHSLTPTSPRLAPSVAAKAAPTMTLAASALRELATAPSHAAAASALRKIDHLQPSLTALVDAGALSPAATHAAVTTIGSMSQALRTYGSPAEAAHAKADRAFGRVLQRHGETTRSAFLASADPRSVTSRLEKSLAKYASAPTADNLALLRSALDGLDAHLADLPHEVTHTTYQGIPAEMLDGPPALLAEIRRNPARYSREISEPTGPYKEVLALRDEVRDVLDAATFPMPREEAAAGLAEVINQAFGAADLAPDASKRAELISQLARYTGVEITDQQARIASERMAGTQKLTARGAVGLAQAELPAGYRPRPPLVDPASVDPAPLGEAAPVTEAPAVEPGPAPTPTSVETGPADERRLAVLLLGIPVDEDAQGLEQPQYRLHPTEKGPGGAPTYAITGPAELLQSGSMVTPLKAATGEPGMPQVVTALGNLRTEGGTLVGDALFDAAGGATTLPPLDVAGQVFGPEPLSADQAAYLAAHGWTPSVEAPDTAPTPTEPAQIAEPSAEATMVAEDPEVQEDQALEADPVEAEPADGHLSIADLAAPQPQDAEPAAPEVLLPSVLEPELAEEEDGWSFFPAEADPALDPGVGGLPEPEAAPGGTPTEEPLRFQDPAEIVPATEDVDQLVEEILAEETEVLFSLPDHLFDDPKITSWAGPEASVAVGQDLLGDRLREMQAAGDSYDPATAELVWTAVAHQDAAQQAQETLQSLPDGYDPAVRAAYEDAVAQETALAISAGISAAPNPGDAEKEALADLHEARGVPMSKEEMTPEFLAALRDELAQNETYGDAFNVAHFETQGLAPTISPGW